jgi:hypothetical protein
VKKVAVKALSVSILALSVFGVTACDSVLSSMEPSVLRERAYKCEMSVDLTAAEIQVCKNILRECKRRQSKGQYDC